MSVQPTLFVSHGAPTLAIDDVAARRFLTHLGRRLDRPRGVLVISAHWEAPRPAVDVSSQPATIHDFRGFPAALYDVRYPAPGAPELAEMAARSIEGAGFGPVRRVERGLDHGAWVPLSLLFPDAAVPVTQLAIQPARDAHHHFALGRALAPLRHAGTLVLATGSLTHNLGAVAWDRREGEPWSWVREFAEEFASLAAAGAVDALLDWRATVPQAVRNHPTAEHLMPFFVALGAAGPAAHLRRLHTSYTYGALAMDVYGFGEAKELQGFDGDVDQPSG